jgi:hypothetical protein
MVREKEKEIKTCSQNVSWIEKQFQHWPFHERAGKREVTFM